MLSNGTGTSFAQPFFYLNHPVLRHYNRCSEDVRKLTRTNLPSGELQMVSKFKLRTRLDT